MVTLAMPMLAPMLRIRLNRLVALPICSLGIRPLVMRGERHKQQSHGAALQKLWPEDVPVSGVQVEVRELVDAV